MGLRIDFVVAGRSYPRFLGITIVLLGAALHALADEYVLRGRVVGVQDGDTITVLDSSYRQFRIRLAGIDAPEKSQAFGSASKRNLSTLVFGRDVELHITKVDRYGRFVAKVVADGRDVCLEQIRAGMAWFYADYQRELSPADRKDYLAAHLDARAARRGLWRDSAPIPPWQFRRGRRR